MCAEYEIRTRKKQIEDALGRSVINRAGRDEWQDRIKLSLRAPILVANGDDIELVESVFPVQPFPNARLSGVDYKAGADADLKKIYERPTWRAPFIEHRAVALMSSFYEPAYWGDDAGRIMRFDPPAGDLFFVAAIQIRARVPATTAAHALLTHTAGEQMLKYHHRLIVVLKSEDALAWLAGGKADPVEKYEFLVERQVREDFKVTPERPMAKGWQKRVDDHLLALELEKQYTKKV